MIHEGVIGTVLDLLPRRNAAARLWNGAKLWLSYKTNPDVLKGRYTPISVSIEVASICNYACRACRHGIAEASNDRPGIPPLMEYDDYCRIVDQLAERSRVHTVDLTGEGESMLHPRIYDILSYTAQRDFRIGLDTNGSVMDVDRLLATGTSYVQFALDGFSEESYGQYRKPGMFETVFGNLRDLCEGIRDSGTKMKVYVKYIISRATEDEVDEAEAYFKQYPFVEFVRETMCIPFPTYEAYRQHEFEATKEDYERWAPRNLTQYDRYCYNPDADNYAMRGLLKPITGNCRAFDIGAYVNVDGRVFPCCVVSRWETEDMCYGNIFEQDLVDLYWSDRANEIRQKYYGSGGHFSYCVGCPMNRD